MGARARSWRTGRLRDVVIGLVLILLLLALAISCLPRGDEGAIDGGEQARGLVVSVDSPALGQVEGFELLTEEGLTLAFDTAELGFRPDFPAAHLNEHMLASEPIVVTYRTDSDRLIVTDLDDAG